jgi:hypothetical protein
MDQASRSSRRGSTLSHGRYGLGAETVADRLGQSRLIHLPFYARDNSSIHLDLAFLFHQVDPSLNDEQ